MANCDIMCSKGMHRHLSFSTSLSQPPGIIHIETVCKEWNAMCLNLTIQKIKHMYGKNSGYVARNTSNFHSMEHLQVVSSNSRELS